MWAARYIERTDQTAQTLYQKIASYIKELKELFAEDVVADLHDEKLSRMLFVDGCALLQILEKGGNLDKPEELLVKVDQLVLVWQDVLLLENQLPYILLKILSPYNDAKLLQTMKVFLKWHHLSPITHDIDTEKQSGYRLEIEEESPPSHLLHLLRDLVLNDPQKEYKQKSRYKNRREQAYKTNKVLNRAIYRNIKELKAAGIRVKKSDSKGLRDISFSYGFFTFRAELKLPEIIVDDSTAPMFLNLIAYEMCPDFENSYEICSFMSMMGSFIDHPNDVTELRQAGVLQNMLGSDEEVTMLFNAINADLVPYTENYLHVRLQIEKHYRNKCKTWIALGYHTYFSTPGTIIAFYAAVAALVLTFIQTLCAVKQT
uniref:UPF0481 protein At3g47200 family n=2 Tax=Cajanus cajan TaxID=3821 RepID=A0A151RNC7_CAJCA|nr:UPF0481 protein At3g47200 family [Cajanus cajan]KYP44046.1 UPF0481 protein At3g47200 family [Cajanus cajan]